MPSHLKCPHCGEPSFTRSQFFWRSPLFYKATCKACGNAAGVAGVSMLVGMSALAVLVFAFCGAAYLLQGGTAGEQGALGGGAFAGMAVGFIIYAAVLRLGKR